MPAGSSSEDARSRELTHSAGNIHSFDARRRMDVFFIHTLEIGSEMSVSNSGADQRVRLCASAPNYFCFAKKSKD